MGAPGPHTTIFRLLPPLLADKLLEKEENRKMMDGRHGKQQGWGVPPIKQPKNGGVGTRMTSGEAAPGVSRALALYLGAHKWQGVAAYEKRRRLPA